MPDRWFKSYTRGLFSSANGAFYTTVQLPVDDAEKFCAWCLTDFSYENETVMMAPAAGFYTTPGAGIDQVRIAYVLKKEDLIRALFLLRKALEKYPEELCQDEFFALYSKKLYSSENGKKRASLPAIRIAIFGVAVGLAVMILSVAVVFGFKDEISSKVIGFGSHLTIYNTAPAE